MNLKTLRTLTFLLRYHGVSLACNMIRLFCCLLLTEIDDGNLNLGIERRGGKPEAKFLVFVIGEDIKAEIGISSARTVRLREYNV
jgi:hypothetical protein